MKDCDANPSMVDERASVSSNQVPPAAHQTQYSSLHHSYKAPQQHTYSSSSTNENRWASSSSSGGGSSSNNAAANASGSSGNNSLFNKLYFSGR